VSRKNQVHVEGGDLFANGRIANMTRSFANVAAVLPRILRS
jgi:hypothetical protein